MAIAPQQKNPITLSQKDYWDWFQASIIDEQIVSTADETDILWNYPSQWGQGFVRSIELREGLFLSLGDYHLHHDLIVTGADRDL